MYFNQSALTFITAFYAGIGIFVLLKNPSNVVNRRFCIFAQTFAVWNFFIFFTLQTNNPVLATYRLRMVFCAAAFIPFSFFFFSTVFPDRLESRLNKILSCLFLIVSIIIASLCPFVVKSIFFENQSHHPNYGPVFPVFCAYFVMCMAYSLYILYRKSKDYYGIKRLQIRYLYMGVAISLFLGSVTNFLLPLAGIWQVEKFVSFASIPIPVAVAYAIVKYHLLDITLIIKRSTVYAIISVFLGIIYFTVSLVIGKMMPVSEYKEAVKNIVSTAVIILTFIYTRESIQYFVERTLFRIKYSHPKILKDSTVLFSSIHDLKGLFMNAAQYLYDAVGIENICILTKDNNKTYSLKASINFPFGNDVVINEEDNVIAWLRENETVLSQEQLNRFSRNKIEYNLEQVLASLRVNICIPIFQKEDLFGIILLGRKINKKIFTLEDIQMFLAFSGQLTMAINNARLYNKLNEAKVYRDNILQSLKSGVIVFEDEKKVTLMNNEAKKILGLENAYSSEKVIEVLGKEIYRFLIYSLRGNVEINEIETIVERNNERIPVGVSTSKLKTETGEKLGTLMLLTDLSELKILRAEKQQADRLAYLGSLAANIAHEIKNPLVPINTYFQLLPHQKNNEEFNTNFQKIALKELGRINRLIEVMFDLTKPKESFMKHIDPNSIIKDTIFLFEQTASDKYVKITATFEETKGYFMIGDEDKIKQVILNVLHNSLTASHQNGQIILKTGIENNLDKFKKMATAHSNCVFFSFVPPVKEGLSDKEYFFINISDNGTGISSEKIPHIFEPFFTDKSNGNGLGLAVVYRIIKDHEGGIYMKSNVGEGTSFYIFLPVNGITIDTDKEILRPVKHF
ncbi:MAG: hypothetical protein E3K37_07985 [Candidatus Kuenenia sp.]|nr:hypothetical protein [Candidatus Kuenenia hertensis]